jgi:hypothetical protein
MQQSGASQAAVTPQVGGAGAWEQIGKNHIGHTLYEDQRGIRSYIVAGVRRTEPVRIIPTYEGMKTAHVHRRVEDR